MKINWYCTTEFLFLLPKTWFSKLCHRCKLFANYLQLSLAKFQPNLFRKRAWKAHYYLPWQNVLYLILSICYYLAGYEPEAHILYSAHKTNQHWCLDAWELDVLRRRLQLPDTTLRFPDRDGGDTTACRPFLMRPFRLGLLQYNNLDSKLCHIFSKV